MDGMGLPMSFGKKAKVQQSNLKNKLAQTKRNEALPKEEPPAPPAVEAGPSSKEEEDEEIGPAPPKRKAEDEVDSDSDDELEEETDRTPITHEIVLKDHTKLVSALALDPSGARVATGGHDYDCKLWDFGGMDARLRPFKSFEPNGSYFIHDMSYSPDGKQILVISGTFYPKVFGRDGDDELEYMKGDVYIRDMKVTKGHIAEINAGKWHPTDNLLFLTAANDSTLRIWDVTNRAKQKSVIVVRSKDRGNKTRVTACAWSPDGKLIAGGCTDGSLHTWRSSSNLARPDQSNDKAHERGSEMTCVAFSPDSKKLVTRSLDGTIKLWEARSLRKPLAETPFESRYSESEVSWSPDGKFILAGTTVDPKDPEAMGEILFLSPEDLSVLRRVPITKGASVVRVQWQSRINQIFASLSNGSVYVLYSPHASVHGALLPLARMPKSKARDIAYTTADLRPVIMTPEGEPMFGGMKHGESLHQKEKRAKKFKPAEPLSGVGRGGRIGASATASFVQEIFQNRVGLEDPREALLKYANEEDQKRAKYLASTPPPGRDDKKE